MTAHLRNASTLPVRAGRAAAAALALALLALPHGAACAALASAAACVFEAAPFILGAGLLPSRLSGAAALLACGCGARLPGALSPAALGLCWLSFGPAVALARAAAAALLWAVRSAAPGPATAEQQAPDAVADLGLVGAAAFAGSLLQGIVPASAGWPPAAFALGALAGALLPCAGAGVAAAAGLRSTAPAAAAGLLAASGIAVFRPWRTRRPAPRNATGVLLVLIGASSWLTLRGGHGFLNPRLALLAPAGALAAALALRSAPATRLPAPWLLPAGLLLALANGSPLPPEAPATLPLGLYPGRAVDFTGVLRPGGRALARAAILCCRADAQWLELPLSRRSAAAPGTWLRARGRIEAATDGLRLEAEHLERVAAPADPFVYL